MKRKRVIIIGAGFSGAAVAICLMKQRNAPDVVLVERRQRFGPGLAYGTKEAEHLLNARAGTMSLFADNPDHFVKWLGSRGRRADRAAFARRESYGRYVEETLRRAGGGLLGARIARQRGDAVACRKTETGWQVTLATGKQLDADAVVLALGHAAPVTPPILAQNVIAAIDPWDARALARLPRGDVLLLGAGLTMVDTALKLARRRKTGTIYALSRRGIAPRAHLTDPAPAAPGAIDLPAPLSDALHAFRAELKRMAAHGEPWQHAIDRLRARTPELWRRLPLAAQARFLRHLRPWWDVHRHRAAPEIAAQIEALQAAGRLRVLAGDLAAAERHGGGIQVQHRQRGSMVRHRLVVAGIVNCTGGARDPWACPEPLMAQLLDEGVARAHDSGLGLDVDTDNHVLDAASAPQQGLFALGPLTQGAFWECTAVPEIRVRAAAIALALAPQS